jgi:pullulanase
MGLNNFCFYENKRDLEMAQEPVECGLYYFGDDLGVNYSPEKTKFRVWAPTARGIKVFIYEKENDREPMLIREFSRDLNGTWVVEIEGDLVNKYFIYEVSVGGQLNRVVDPYTRGLGTNSRLGLIVDLNRTNPEGWADDKRVKLERPQDAVIYEVHVRDFSSSPFSGIKNKGKYLAFTEEGTKSPEGLKTGIDHLKELGVTHVHLQPVFDFATVDDTSNTGYNWGYDPYFYNVPEGSYATNPADDTRIREFKRMVKALHKNNLGIIMDVVYNHTYATGSSPFNLLVPRHYYRFDCFGNYSNGSGTGNEIASEKPMVRKFILDSVKYWAEEYHIDGFRFDLMALHDRKTMEAVEKTLKEIDPSIIIYGEPWMGGLSPLDPGEQFTKGAQKGMKIAVFNDHFRNAIKGDNDGMGTGFVSGAHHQVDNIKRGIVGAIFYNDQIKDFAEQPSETVNYVSSHDNLTLWDKLCKSNYNDSEEVRIKMDRMAQALIFTSQGIPFIQGGEEILRTKWGNHNSYNAGDQVNQLKWERKTRYYDTFKYYQGLIKLRREHSAFRMKNAEEIRNHLHFLPVPENTVGFIIKDHANGDSWKDIVVFHNPHRESVFFKLPGVGQWNIVVNDKHAGVDVLGKVENGGVTVPPISTMVLFKEN